jgi:hypothetical protein
MWQKLGRIFEINQINDLLWTHSSYPVPNREDENLFVYFAARDKKGTSRVFRFLFDAQSGILEKNSPLIEPGPIGTFDCDGVAPRCFVKHDNKQILYLIGWNKCQTFPYSLSIGAAFYHDGKFQKIGQIIGRNRFDPIFCTSPCVIHEDGIFKMWYCSCTEWQDGGPKYLIKYCESHNGLDWLPSEQISLGYEVDESLGWPCVLKNGNSYEMYFSKRKNSSNKQNNNYHLGHAVSYDGIKFFDSGISPLLPSKNSLEWDSEMICYTTVFEDYLFYNGNGFGKSGIGVAKKNYFSSTQQIATFV